MKKFLKGCLTFALAVVCLLGFTACKTPLSATTVSVDKVEFSNGLSTNGGITAVHDGYLYFINGTKTNNGKTSGKIGKICRVKLDVATGEIDDDTYEVVVNDFAGFGEGSLFFFGNFMYYTSPSTDVNYKGDVLYNKTRFRRYDLVNKKAYTLYTTKQNSSSNTVEYAYYITGENLNLVVYESGVSSITSLKIGNTTKTNYVIKNVANCLLSENQGKCVTDGATADANSFVIYSKTNDITGDTEVYRTSPTVNNSACIANEGYSLSLLTIKNGKVVYSFENKIFATTLTGTNSDKLGIERTNMISYATYEYVVFIENDDETNSISVLYYDSSSGEVAIVKWIDGVEMESRIIKNIGAQSSSSSSSSSSQEQTFAMIGLTTIEEIIQEDDPTTEDIVEPTLTETVTYLLYINSKIVYKLELEREGVESVNPSPVQLSKTTVEYPSDVLIPEVIGNYLYIFGKELDDSKKETGKIYLYRCDLTIALNENLIDTENDGYASLVSFPTKKK